MKGDLTRTSCGLQWSPEDFFYVAPVSHEVCKVLYAERERENHEHLKQNNLKTMLEQGKMKLNFSSRL